MVHFTRKRNLSSSHVRCSCSPLPILISFCLPEKLRLKGPKNSMAISQDLLEILACPACKAKVELKPDGSALKCVQCHRVYQIRDDIPVMLIDEATIEDE